MKPWVLLDRESTMFIFGEYKYLTNIKTVPTTPKVTTNEGLLTTNKQGHLKNYGNLWYHIKAMSNMLSMSNVNNENNIIYYYKNGDRIIVINTRPGGYDMIFKASNYSIYFNGMKNT